MLFPKGFPKSLISPAAILSSYYLF